MVYEISSQSLGTIANKLLEQQDVANALQVWHAVLRLFPNEPDGYRGAAQAYKTISDYEGAGGVLRAGVELIPDNQQLAADYAWLAHNRKEWAEAAARWESYYEKFPGDFAGFLFASVALRELARFDEAEQVLEIALKSYPDNSQLLSSRAWTAHHRKDWQKALQRWNDYRERFPDDPIGYSATGVVLCELKRFKEADVVLQEGLRHYPDHGELIGNHAWAAYHAHDWPEALKRWTKYRDQFPADPLGHYQTMLVLGELGRFEEANILASSSVEQDKLDPELGKFMLGFESLGDNCEFGVVQRHYGAEPLGLLRFTSTPPKLLILALNDDLTGIGEPENTTLGSFNGEYMTGDKRYYMSMHTFIREAGDDREKRFVNVCRRIRFLRGKLLQDLKDAEKTFVYGCHQAVRDEEIRELWTALRRYGDNRLLFVLKAPDQGTIGTVRPIESTLVVGYIDKFSVDAPSFELWLHICRQANALLRQNLKQAVELELT